MDERRRNPIPEHIQRRITKIFVTNLPDGCTGSVLASQIREFGKIFGLYIAKKRDKGGNRFGFVSMLDVKDKEVLLKNLRSIRMGENKLWFNIARFVLEDGEINTAHDKPAPKGFVNSNVKGGVEQSGTKFRTSERSFKGLFERNSITIDSHVNAFSTLHGRALVVRMIDLEALKNIQVILNDICPGFGKVQYLGGLDMLISFEESELAAKVLEVAKLLKDKFYSITLWEGQSLSFERLAWLKVQGIPLHLLTNDVINIVGGKFGKVAHKAMKSESDSDLSFEYIGVLVGDGKRISEEVVLNWKNRKFRVWVTEELGDWIPEFYAVKSGEQEIDSTNDEENDGVANDVDMPEVLPVNTAGVGVNVSDDVEPIILERNDGDINDNSDCQSSPMIEKNLNSEDTNETFVPAVNFDFDQAFENINNTVISASNVVKRKKFKKSEVGRPSCAYTSSNESLKVVKKPKNSNNDLFGLNSLLGITDGEPGSEDDSSENEEDGSIDLNCNPNVTDKADQPVMEERHSVHMGNHEQHVDVNLAEEIEATKLLGEKLGVNLAGHDKLIWESIINEGLQTGNK